MKCEQCNGNKKIMDMGFIEKKCNKCNGLGIVDDKIEMKIENRNDLSPNRNDLLSQELQTIDTKEDISKTVVITESIVTKRKPGRPKN